MEEKSGSRPHACFLQNRAAANLTGVREVVSFDESGGHGYRSWTFDIKGKRSACEQALGRKGRGGCNRNRGQYGLFLQ